MAISEHDQRQTLARSRRSHGRGGCARASRRLLHPGRAHPSLLRATADRLASNELRGILDRLVDTAEASARPSRRFIVSGTTPERAADELLQQARINKPPVPIVELAQGCGVLVIQQPLPHALSGLVFEIDDHGVIGVNSQHHEHRRRFTIAHELGHYLLAHHDRFHLDIEDGHLPTYDWASERGANDFAADILMPRAMVVDAFGKTPNAAVLARCFNVSELAMGYRLVNLGLR